ncbi:MAG: electron transfer flavoprotein subunit alpha/FixB family protein [Verrucomicrobia bacterium]|nr:electron transfer flavoprotein subunit alpha/FixB family protein [Verrucomicrobiota bacterium]MBI3868708.1 electron transfer flavoprotein subunit alpha/FixB family protein [Verrucomicrobiota bacterium]
MARILVLAEHERGQLKLATLAALGFAAKLVEIAGGGEIHALVIGHQVEAVANGLRRHGATSVILADDSTLSEPLADRWASAVVDAARSCQADCVAGAASTLTKDILPRAAALLDAGMISDVVDVRRDDRGLLFKRVLHAGNALATVRLDGPLRVITVRAAAFSAPSAQSAESPIVPLQLAKQPSVGDTQFVAREQRISGRPDATEARIVVSGGRALKNAEDFERLVGGLADALGGAVGSSRALVDSGITPNSLQIGQTGKVVAPDLYIAVGISGAIQHMAGMKDTKVIVAINKDPEAPIFEVADYGLVADVYQAIPEWLGKIEKR